MAIPLAEPRTGCAFWISARNQAATDRSGRALEQTFVFEVAQDSGQYELTAFLGQHEDGLGVGVVQIHRCFAVS